jgi:hypothetical protein
MNDIERAYGDQPLLDEMFETHGNLTDEEKQIWKRVYELDGALSNLIIKAMDWAMESGYKACQGHEEENKFYDSQYHQKVRIPKLRAYFKRLRQGVSQRGGNCESD